MPAFSAIKALAYLGARKGFVASTVQGWVRQQGLDATGINIAGMFREAVEDIANEVKLAAINFNASPTRENTMLPRVFRRPERYKYVVGYDITDANNQVIRGGYTIWSDSRLTRGEIEEEAILVVEGSPQENYRGSLRTDVSYSNFRLQGAFFAEGSI